MEQRHRDQRDVDDVALVGIDLNHGRRCARARELLERPERRSCTADAKYLADAGSFSCMPAIVG